MRAKVTSGPNCALFTTDGTQQVELQDNCNVPLRADYLCEFAPLPTNAADAGTPASPLGVVLAPPSRLWLPVPRVTCPDGHLTHAFLACDAESVCWRRPYGDAESEVWGVPSVTSCPAPMTSLPAMFTCSSGAQRVPYSLVCDHRQQCGDGSDESFCVFPPCSASTPLQCDTTSQVHYSGRLSVLSLSNLSLSLSMGIVRIVIALHININLMIG